MSLHSFLDRSRECNAQSSRGLQLFDLHYINASVSQPGAEGVAQIANSEIKVARRG